MYKFSFSLIPFLILLHLFYVYSAVKNTSDNYLPLVMIKHHGKLEYPDKIEKANINEVLGFTGNTQFSKNGLKDQIFFCPSDSTKKLDQIKEANKLMTSSPRLRKIHGLMSVSDNCLLRKTFKKEDALKCAIEPQPNIYWSKKADSWDETTQRCGSNNAGLLYKFAYELCTPISFFERMRSYIPLIFQPDFETYYRRIPFRYQRLTVYEMCLNYGTTVAMYTKHELKSVNLLFDERLEHEKEKKYEISNYHYGYFNDFKKLIEFYDRLSKNPTEQNESSNREISDDEDNENPYTYLAEMLVSPDDMMTAVLKKSTFHYVNVRPMQRGVVKLWNYIGLLIRKNFRDVETENEIEIYTGAFTLQDPENYLPKNWPEDVPHVWIKVLYEKKTDPNSGPTLAIIMKNQYKFQGNPYDDKFDLALEELCGEDHCKYFKQNKTGWNKFYNLLRNVRCCPFNDRIDSYFNINLEHGDTLLPIADLTHDRKNVG